MDDTEFRNPRFIDLDRWATADAVAAMFEGQLAAIASIAGEIRHIADAADAAARRLGTTGRLIYVGAGTSGRIAVQDGVELGPTFNWPADRIVFMMAGGPAALLASAEGAEDDVAEARRLVADHAIGTQDVVIAIAASGRTPFTLAALTAARDAGALTVGIANNGSAPLIEMADYPICLQTGAEVLAGSTRMKAGTAQRAVVTMLSTAIMLRLGRVYRGLMVDMVVSNDKLVRRAQAIVATLTGCSDTEAVHAVESAGRDIKAAVLMAMGATPASAAALLKAAQGDLGAAIAAFDAAEPSPQ